MKTSEFPDSSLELLRSAIVAMVRGAGPDMTSRQLAVFLTCYFSNREQTVRGLAAELRLSKPAISRALDRLTAFQIVRRKADPADGRSVLVARTAKGHQLLKELALVMVATGLSAIDNEISTTSQR